MDAELEEGAQGAIGAVKVDWNVTGTVLSTAGEDAKVRLWKCERLIIDPGIGRRS